MPCFFSPRAERDLEEIGDAIATDNPPRALSFIVALRARCEKIEAMPLAAPLRPELGEGLRMVVFGNYLIFYRVLLETVRIERVLHGARDIPDLFGA